MSIIGPSNFDHIPDFSDPNLVETYGLFFVDEDGTLLDFTSRSEPLVVEGLTYVSYAGIISTGYIRANGN